MKVREGSLSGERRRIFSDDGTAHADRQNSDVQHRGGRSRSGGGVV